MAIVPNTAGTEIITILIIFHACGITRFIYLEF